MTDMGNQNFDQFNPATGESPKPAPAPQDDAQTTPSAAPAHAQPQAERAQASDNARQPIGVVLEIAGTGSLTSLEHARLN